MNTRIGQIERWHVALLAVAVCMAYGTGWLSAPSVLLGGAVMGLNFRLLRAVVSRLLSPGPGHSPAIVVVLLLAKFALLIALLGVLFWRLPLDPLGVAVGASMLLLACVLSTASAPAPALS